MVQYNVLNYKYSLIKNNKWNIEQIINLNLGLNKEPKIRQKSKFRHLKNLTLFYEKMMFCPKLGMFQFKKP